MQQIRQSGGNGIWPILCGRSWAVFQGPGVSSCPERDEAALDVCGSPVNSHCGRFDVLVAAVEVGAESAVPDPEGVFCEAAAGA